MVNLVREESEIVSGEPTESATLELRSKKRVLVVDDNVDGAEMLAMMLELSGYETRTASDGLEAIDVVKAFAPHVVFLDIAMPGLDGYEVAKRLRAEPAFDALILVALTGWGGDDDKRRTKDAGFDRHITKPVEPAAVTALFAGLASATE